MFKSIIIKYALPVFFISLLTSCTKESHHLEDFDGIEEIKADLETIQNLLPVKIQEILDKGISIDSPEEVTAYLLLDAEVQELNDKLEHQFSKLNKDQKDEFKELLIYSYEQVQQEMLDDNLDLETKLRMKTGNFKGTPCYDSYEIAVLAAYAQFGICLGLAGATGWGGIGCAALLMVEYIAANATYSSCLSQY